MIGVNLVCCHPSVQVVQAFFHLDEALLGAIRLLHDECLLLLTVIPHAKVFLDIHERQDGCWQYCQG